MKNSPLLSLIVPMFNARSTIEACLASLLTHAPPEIEIIVVDDGSGDDAAVLLREVFAAHLAARQLILIEQANQGASAARNAGLERARGLYVGFVDADDIVSQDYFNSLLSAIRSRPSDIIEFGYYFWDGALPIRVGVAQHSITRFGHFYRSEIDREVFGASMWYAWTRIFRRRLFAEVRFPVGVHFCEDMMTVSRIYNLASTITSLPEAIYYYRVNPTGATRQARQDYVTQLTAYYLSILSQRNDCTDLLKGAIQYCIYSSQQNMAVPYQLDARLERDLRRIRRKVNLFRYMPSRRLRILLFPRLSRWLSESLGRDRG